MFCVPIVAREVIGASDSSELKTSEGRIGSVDTRVVRV